MFLRLPRIVQCLHFPQPAKKTGFPDQMTRPAMIGMTVIQRIAQHDLRAVFPDGPDQQPLMRFVIPEKPIRHAQVVPDIQLEDRPGPRRFHCP
jgi:hypothetical protein